MILGAGMAGTDKRPRRCGHGIHPRTGVPCAIAMMTVSLACLACTGRPTREATNPLVASLIFENAYPDTREALTSSVDYRLTADNFARWEQAQENLDELPESAFTSGRGTGQTAIDRAVSRLESSPLARAAVESAGLSVRDFVLETIALAQATESVQTGKSTSPTLILAENDQFVREYRSGELLAGRIELPAETNESPDLPGPADPPDSFETPEAPQPPEAPEVPDAPEVPEAPALPELRDFSDSRWNDPESARAFAVQVRMRADARAREAAEARLQRRAAQAARPAQAAQAARVARAADEKRSQREQRERELDEFREQIRQQVAATLERYRDARLRESPDGAYPWRELLNQSWAKSRNSVRQAVLRSIRESRRYLREAQPEVAMDSPRSRR